MRRYEIVIIWETGEKEIADGIFHNGYSSYKDAVDTMNGIKMAFGEQVWCCVREKRV